MRLLLRFLLVSAIALTLFTFTTVHPANAAGCVLADVNGPADFYINLVLGQHIVATMNGAVVAEFQVPVPFPAHFLVNPGGHLVVADVAGVCPGSSAVTWYTPGDDRLDRSNAAQPVALYCRQGDLQVWAIDPLKSFGTLSLVVTKLDIARVKDSKPTQNTLIKASTDGKLKLYYLPASDQLSFMTTYLNSDKPYNFLWKGCA